MRLINTHASLTSQVVRHGQLHCSCSYSLTQPNRAKLTWTYKDTSVFRWAGRTRANAVTAMEFDAIWCSVLRVPRSTVGGDWRFKILSGSHLQGQLRAENVDTSAIANSPSLYTAQEGPISRTSRNFSSDINHPFVSSIRRLFEHWNLSVILPPLFWFIDLFRFASISGRDAATTWANYCGPIKARPQHRELRALLFYE